ncbi:DUF362 domain-containing protein [candidate division KSB1 bacterium]|nr:DUF362 domain-containing protein [candidate division KSB1 bacterium]
MDKLDIEKNQAISRVGLLKCDTYQQDEVVSVVERLLFDVIMIQDLIKPGFKVHIKPNLLSLKGPDRAVTTHPAIVRAVVNLIKPLGVQITIGDSPAGMTKAIEKNWLATGMKQVADETGVRLVPFENSKVTLKHVRGNTYFISSIVADADVVINLCKLKTHSLTLMTGAIKNMFGVIPGIKKSDYHRMAPDVDGFSDILVDVFETVKPQINIMDAIVAMEGNGPSSGNPVHLGYVLGSRDAVATDAIAAFLLGFNNDEIVTTAIAYERGLGEKRLDVIDVVGLSLDELEIKPVVLPSKRLQSYIPNFIMDMIGKLIWVRPCVNKDTCKKCGLCVENCPVQAMTPVNGIPKIDYSICIKCFCCDEICPYGAIQQEMSWLVKRLS